MKEDLTKRVEALKAKNISPKLGIIRVGARLMTFFMKAGQKRHALESGWIVRCLNSLWI
jgi:methylenetetrahydrofolate dehydrogenase (NADP+)/methenyltetrahydrofolate cyclohydrolase